MAVGGSRSRGLIVLGNVTGGERGAAGASLGMPPATRKSSSRS